jgi:hypothetical protein
MAGRVGRRKSVEARRMMGDERNIDEEMWQRIISSYIFGIKPQTLAARLLRPL